LQGALEGWPSGASLYVGRMSDVVDLVKSNFWK